MCALKQEEVRVQTQLSCSDLKSSTALGDRARAVEKRTEIGINRILERNNNKDGDRTSTGRDRGGDRTRTVPDESSLRATSDESRHCCEVVAA